MNTLCQESAWKNQNDFIGQVREVRKKGGEFIAGETLGGYVLRPQKIFLQENFASGLHDFDPYRKSGAGARKTHHRVVIVTHPYDGEQARTESGEPRILGIRRSSGLCGVNTFES